MRSTLITLLSSCSFLICVLGAGPDARPDLDKPIALAKAVEEFNKKYPDNNPLTEAEVIAAVRQIRRRHPNIPDEIFELYQKVVEERVLPPGFYLSHMSLLIDGDWEYEVDWKDLTLEVLPQHKLPPELKLKGFNYRIRARFISSKPRGSNDTGQVGQRLGSFCSAGMVKLRLELEELRKVYKGYLLGKPPKPLGGFWRPGEFERLQEQAIQESEGSDQTLRTIGDSPDHLPRIATDADTRKRRCTNPRLRLHSVTT